jgi:hypothetical protein
MSVPSPAFKCLGLIALSACLHAHVAAPIEIRVLPDTVVMNRQGDAIYLRINSSLRNRNRRPLYYEPCWAYLERHMDTTWATVWTPMCLDGSAASVLAPGASVPIVVDVAVFFGPIAPGAAVKLPRLDPRMTPGEYRIVVPVGAKRSRSGIGFAKPLPIEYRASQSFIIR